MGWTALVDSVSLEMLPMSRFQEAQAFYATVGYFDAIADDCSVFAAQLDGRIIGVARLAPENGVMVLRGMMVAKQHQRNGVGARLLQFMAPRMAGSDVFCLPHGWLEEFYGQVGFVKIDPSEAPEHLQERLTKQRPKYPEMIIMARRSARPSCDI
ncbi:MAG: GNAT family N-acetyltransferase [Alphaproteobacteria bacterium]|nr:GNAT family N-acetyltransferase [Alphaproteobacteria bacterium]MDE2110292.1 GNAT family N-acetyltransferase [Alphaproteobacteria bacterium]MDE2494831.1 GNAT family N-acetyltransferase [Alphaproteobacteria bacterium]